MSLNRFFVKKVETYVVYDRLNGSIVGDTINHEEVVKRILTPKGLKYDERMDPVAAKIPLGSEELFHKAVCKLRYATVIDKALDG